MSAAVIAAGVAALALVALLLWMRLPKPFTLTLDPNVAKWAESIQYPKYKITGPVLVTGGAGFLGRNIVSTLTAQGIKVVVFDFDSRYQAPAGVTFVHGNLVDKAQVLKALRDNRIELVFHVASPDPNSTNKKLFTDVNVTGTANVIAACREAGVRSLVYTSSASVVWQGKAQDGVDESVPYPASFRDFYAQTKAEAEAMVMAAGKDAANNLTTISLRPHAIFGPNDRTMVPTVVEMAKAGKSKVIVGDGSNIVDWTYVGNVVHSHMLAAQVAQAEGRACKASGRTYFITNGQPMPFWVFMNWILLGLGYPPASMRMPFKLLLGIATVAQAVLGFVNGTLRAGKAPLTMTLSPSRLQIAGTAHHYDITAAKRDLGYAPLWDMQTAVYLTLRHFEYLRVLRPKGAALENARRGNLIALKLLFDPEAKHTDSATTKAGTMRGVNEVFADESKLPEYTREEVARHAKQDDLWVIIDGQVYDLTRYVDPHPGGLEIMKNAGGDASAGFHGDQHPEHVMETARKYLIGRLAK